MQTYTEVVFLNEKDLSRNVGDKVAVGDSVPPLLASTSLKLSTHTANSCRQHWYVFTIDSNCFVSCRFSSSSRQISRDRSVTSYWEKYKEIYSDIFIIDCMSSNAYNLEFR